MNDSSAARRPWVSLDEAVAELRAGRPVIIVDAPEREDEADLVLAAEFAISDHVAFFIREAMGLLCVALEGRRLDELGVRLMTERNSSHQQTPFTISVEAATVSTGVSAADRAATIRALIDPATRPEDLLRPGHVFPLRAADGGLTERQGHTEASLELCRRAGLYPAAVIAEIMTPDGRMARGPELIGFAERHGLKILPIESLLQGPSTDRSGAPAEMVRRRAESWLPTARGNFRAVSYQADGVESVELALVMGQPAASQPALVRIHSECLTGDVFKSIRCDCGRQLDRALELISAQGSGVLLYLRQEGRGIGLLNKLRAYSLQDEGLDTVAANHALGFPADLRDYRVAAEILHDLGIAHVRLLTNNPRKVQALAAAGIEVERAALEVEADLLNRSYLATKRARLGHLLELADGD